MHHVLSLFVIVLMYYDALAGKGGRVVAWWPLDVARWTAGMGIG